MPLSAEELATQRELLNVYRRNAIVYQRQFSMHQAAHVPPIIYNGLRETLRQITRLKQVIREGGGYVTDRAEDTFDLSALETGS